MARLDCLAARVRGEQVRGAGSAVAYAADVRMAGGQARSLASIQWSVVRVVISKS